MEPKAAKINKLSFSLDPANGAPVYRQIIQQIEYAVLSKRIRPGDRLPTIRSLAVELKINPNTIAKAYGELEIRGILSTQVGSGTYVSDKGPLLEKEASAAEGLNRKIQELLGRFVEDMKALGVDGEELVAIVKNYGKGTRTPSPLGSRTLHRRLNLKRRNKTDGPDTAK
ncbi:MAG: GntR family transcriptional regulator [Spirochaetaceae bacterium]|jgi:GntR family transcriptional regulator|nr:GntR family transcriptional regulator [Spirochaetaceae bacterium]